MLSPEQTPQLLVYITFFAMFAAFVLSKIAEASEAFAKLFGPLGRYWRRKVEQDKAERTQEIHSEAIAAVQSAMDKMDKRPDYKALKTQLETILLRVEEMEKTEVINTAYLIEDAKWHRITELTLAEKFGELEFTLPPRVSYTEFADAYRKQHGWDALKR
jgi:hypothetical protein